MYGVVDQMIGLHYEPESRRFKNTQNETIKYGWEQEPTQASIQYNTPQVQVQTSVIANESSNNNDMPFEQPDDSEYPF